jgi:hypothetical protein
MEQTDTKPLVRKWAIALIIVNLIRAGGCFISFFQAKYQIVSPLIPQSIVLEIVASYMIVGLGSIVLTIAAFGFFVYSKYMFSIIICVLSLILAQFYFFFY